MKKILIIQTSFIGDVILATSLVETVHHAFPDAHIHFLVRKGNEALLRDHPHLNKVWIWDKGNKKLKGLLKLGSQFRKERFDWIINPHRYASSGFLTVLSKAKLISGFQKNPFSFAYSYSIKHQFNGTHEIERNGALLKPVIADTELLKPRLYPSPADYDRVKALKTANYVCMAPTSVWYTKQWPKDKWIELVKELPSSLNIYLLGAPTDKSVCLEIAELSQNKNVHVLAGELSLLESAALMKDAVMNYTNDSAPMHLASAMNAPTTAIYCSTTPSFGFGPLADVSRVKEYTHKLPCKPCGIHGHNQCPEGHFKCGNLLSVATVKHI